VCADLGWFGIFLDPVRNGQARGETRIDASSSRVQLWIVPANEELIVARQTKEYLQSEPRL
jgi:acetate kinase